MDMEAIIEFLEARLAEDEGLAMALHGGDGPNAEDMRVERIFAEARAKRDTIDYVTRLSKAGRPEFDRDHLERFLILMASVYSQHPDHDDQWF